MATGRERTRWERWLPAASIVACAWLALFPITSVDAYYHLAVGRAILDHGRIPDRGIGSATFGDAAWHDNEWGFQALVALVGRDTVDPSGVRVLTPWGRAGLVLLRAMFLAATLLLISRRMRLAGVEPLPRALAIVLAAFLTFGNLFWDVRPQIVSYAAFAAVGALLEADRRGTRWAAAACLGVIALWSNFHGAFVIGIVLIGCEAAGEIADGLIQGPRRTEARRRGFKLLAVAALAPLAACVNPHGVEQVIHPFRYVLEPAIIEWNVDWGRPDWLHLPLLVLTLALLVVTLLSRGRPRAADLLTVGAFAGLFSTAIRHLPLLTLVSVPLLAESLGPAARRRAFLRPLDLASTAPSTPFRRRMSAALGAVGIVALSGAKFVGVVPKFEERMVRTSPERGVRFIASEGIAGNGFNAYRFGGFLMYRLYPQERVFMDGRNDLYGLFRREVYNRILLTAPGWEALWEDAVRRYDVGWILLDAGEPLVPALASRGGWIVDDGGAPFVTDSAPGKEDVVLMLRDTPENRSKRPALEALARGRS